MNKITLKRPVTHEGKVYDAIEVDEPSVGAVAAFTRASSGSEDAAAVIEGTLAMLAFETSIPIDALRRIKISDLNVISEALAPFLEVLKPASGETGDSSART